MSDEVIRATDANCMNTYRRFRIAAARGEGAWLWDTGGKKYLDFTSGIAVSVLGHCHPALIGAIKEQAGELIHTSNLFYTKPQARLAELLTRHSFADRVFFCNSGAEACEGAIKLSRKRAGEAGRSTTVVCAEGAFHGRTLGALGATSGEAYRRGFDPLPEGFVFVPYGDAAAAERAVREHGACAFMVEPIQGENGVVIPPKGYLSAMREVCSREGALLVLDEIQTGMGRTGKFLAHEHCGITPDIAAIAKGLGGGVPCGAVLATGEAGAYFTPGSHGSTFGGGPLACACAAAVIEEISGSSLAENAAVRGRQLLEGLGGVAGAREARGVGLMAGVEFSSDTAAKAAVDLCAEKGLLTILTAGNVMRLLPPLTVSGEQVNLAVSIIREAAGEVADG